MESRVDLPSSVYELFMSRRAVYTGSFDPITLGHLNVIERSSRLVDELIVGVGTNIEKSSLFTGEERVELITRTTRHLSNVRVEMFTGLAVQFVRQCESASSFAAFGRSPIWKPNSQ